jgi:integrase/recombinase XerC
VNGLYPNVADNIKGAKVTADNTKKEAFTEADIKTILQSIDRSTTQGKRNYAMILLAVVGGLRIIELQRADIQDIQTIRGQSVIYIQGKGRDAKDEYIKLIDEVKEAIDDYLQTRTNRQPNAPLFTGTSNRAKDERITETSISRLIKSVFKDSGYDSNKLTAHSLRHTSNTLLFKAGADIYKVQQHARHKDPKTTEIYLHIADRDADTSEQDIYNQIFNTSKQDTKKTILAILDKLNNDEQCEVLRYMQRLHA